MSRALFALGLAALAAGCGRPRGEMSDGERLYLAKCTSCHRTYQPGERTPAQWHETVAKMQRLKKVTLAPEQEATILAFLAGAQQAAGR